MEILESFFKKVIFIHPFIYPILIVLLTLIIRFIICLFKTWAISNGEVDEVWEEEKDKISKKYKYWEIFRKSFMSRKGGIKIDDYWLPAIIGVAELILFPILIMKSLWTFIGAWIGIKTASSWGGWQKTRTAYNRFLLGNLLSLTASYVLTLVIRFLGIEI